MTGTDQTLSPRPTRRPGPKAPVDEPQVIMDSLRRIVLALHRSAQRIRAETPLTGARALVLHHVGRRAGLSLGELAGLTFTLPSTVSEVVGRLETEGYLTRRRSATDGRRLELHLTEAGRAAVGGVETTAQEQLMAALTALPGAHRRALAQGLSAWVRQAGLAGAPPVMFFEPDPAAERRP